VGENHSECKYELQQSDQRPIGSPTRNRNEFTSLSDLKEGDGIEEGDEHAAAFEVLPVY
jgi:hypothetical protein